jgi:hypothetical protein
MKFEYLDRFSKKYSNRNFRDNPVSWNQVVQCGRTDERRNWQTVRQTGGRQNDLTKFLVAFFNFAEAPKNLLIIFIGNQFVYVKWGDVLIFSRPVD